MTNQDLVNEGERFRAAIKLLQDAVDYVDRHHLGEPIAVSYSYCTGFPQPVQVSAKSVLLEAQYSAEDTYRAWHGLLGPGNSYADVFFKEEV